MSNNLCTAYFIKIVVIKLGNIIKFHKINMLGKTYVI